MKCANGRTYGSALALDLCLMPRAKRRNRCQLLSRQRVAHCAQRRLTALHASISALEVRYHVIAEDFVVAFLGRERRPVVIE